MDRILLLLILLSPPLFTAEGLPGPAIAEVIALARSGEWERVAIVTSDGKRLRGLIQVDQGAVSFKRTVTGDGEPLDTASIASIEYTGGRDPYSKQAERCIKKGAWEEALAALAQAPAELQRDPAVAQLRLVASAAKHHLDALRARLLDSRNADASTIQALADWIAATGERSLPDDLSAGVADAWHRLVPDLSEEQRTHWIDTAKQVRLTLGWDPEAPARLEAARTAMASGDAAAAAKAFQEAWDGHARFADADRIAMATALLDSGRKAQAAGLLRELPLALREDPAVGALLQRAGVPLFEGTFGFRGDGTGVFHDCEPPTAAQVVWKLAMPTKSNSSPCVAGDKVFTCAEPNRLYCVGARDGTIIWERANSFAEVTGASERDSNYPKSDWMEFYGYTSPTPCTNGRVVVAVYGIGLAVALDMAGNRLWHREFVGHSRLSGISSSPIMFGDRVVMPLRKDGCVCVEASTGKVLWTAGEQGGDSSLCPVSIDGRIHLLSGRGNCLALSNGNELFSDLKGGGGGPNNWGPTPVGGDGLAFFHWHFKDSGQNNTAIRAWHLEGPQAGQMAWEFLPSKDGNIRQRMGRSPLYWDGRLYAIDDSGRLHVLDAVSGSLLYEQTGLGGGYVCLSKAGAYLYHFSKSDCVIFKPGDSYQEVARFKHGMEAHIGSPAFAGRRLYFRGKQALWCFGGG